MIKFIPIIIWGEERCGVSWCGKQEKAIPMPSVKLPEGTLK